MNCLIIKQPWVDEILAGTKRIEYRTRPTKITGRIGLIASGGSGQVLGEVNLTGCRPSKKCPGEFEWLLSNPLRYGKAKTINQRPGCVIWVKSGLKPKSPT
jgi:hypothetical protein